jgi:steroid delta-isomerase-like uncharacterized protein
MTDVPATASDQFDHASARGRFEQIYALLNEHDVDELSVVFTEDVEFRDDAWPHPIHGLAEMAHFLTALWHAVPDLRFELQEGPYLADDGRHVAVRVVASGTATGRYDPPGFDPTNGRLAAEYGGFFELAGGRIRRGRVILNMNDVALQVGAAPAAGSRGEWLLVRLQRLNARRMRRRPRA